MNNTHLRLNRWPYLTFLCLFLFSSTTGIAATNKQKEGNASFEQFFSDAPPLSEKDQKLIDQAQQWIDGKSYPYQQGGKITYLYGEGQATLICAPLKLCILELGEGEQVSENGIHIGDATRWMVNPSVGKKEKTVLIVKPVDVGLETTMALVTNKRVYNVRLISQLKDYTPLVTFHYPDAKEEAWEEYHKLKEEREAKLEEKRAVEAKEQAILDQRMAELRKQEIQSQMDVWTIRKEANTQRVELEKIRRQQEQEYGQGLRALEVAHRTRMEAQSQQRYDMQLQAENERIAFEESLQRKQQEQRRILAEQAQQQIQQAAYQNQPQQGNYYQDATYQSLHGGIGQLDFNYAVSECPECQLKPVNIYNNGQQTVIEMNQQLGAEAPALMVMNGDQNQLVNYRLIDNRYIVDLVFNEAMLVSGTGKRQKQIIIKRSSGV